MNVNAIDLTVFVTANLFNLLTVGLFLARTAQRPALSRAIGVPMLLTAIPMMLAAALNALGARSLWLVMLPLPLIVHCAVELLLDYVLRLEFRQTALLGPYLLVFYLGQMGGIGYAFLIGRVYGFVTLGTYFASLLAMRFSYSRVRHG
jgi:hypothetical protein